MPQCLVRIISYFADFHILDTVINQRSQSVNQIAKEFKVHCIYLNAKQILNVTLLQNAHVIGCVAEKDVMYFQFVVFVMK